MAFRLKRECFEEGEAEEESLSLSDFPVSAGEDDCACKSSDAADEFEFQVSAAGGLLGGAGEAGMCVADEVFFQGQILPLRPSVSSDSGFLSRGASRRSESLDQYYSAAILGLGFHSTSRSSSTSSRSSSNGSGMSRSHSSNNFYARPSPTPRIRTHRKTNSGRRSASSVTPGWGIFRLGIAKAPEIELHDIMLRRPGGGGGVSARTNNAEADHAKKEKSKRSRSRGGLICRCSPEAVEPVAASTKQKAAEARSKNLRLFAWLHQGRSFTKAAARC
ncbi:uncharacterized protein LOC122043952 [Zingiber officinale]|uniref:Uncharacterized protein n=1 Tax=Zingiber officinale TaxID=94328 RepID=A0A8J5LZI2_ZINOF|nr:uncharacterized protein LOC122043952 [Zingiber officinale]KAG6529052.1 hypothetical protein ZIOFF_011246 [Zingiber officinale]